MLETKKWYLSESIWGGFLAVVGAILGLATSLEIDAALIADLSELIPAAVSSVIAAIGGVLAIHGRIRARAEIE